MAAAAASSASAREGCQHDSITARTADTAAFIVGSRSRRIQPSVRESDSYSTTFAREQEAADEFHRNEESSDTTVEEENGSGSGARDTATDDHVADRALISTEAERDQSSLPPPLDLDDETAATR